MRRLTDYLRGVSVLLSDVAACCLTLYVISAAIKMSRFSLPLSVWAGYLLLLFLADYILAGIGLPVNLYLLINGIGIAAGSFLTVRNSLFIPRYEFHVGYAVLAAAASGIHAAVLAYRLPGSNRILRYVDILILLLGFYLYTIFWMGQEPEPQVTALTLGVMLLDMWMVGRLRTGEEGQAVIQGAGVGGRLVLAVLFAASLLLTGFLVGSASGQVKSAVDVMLVILKWAAAAVEFIFGIIGFVLGRIILFLAYLLPSTPSRARENIAMNLGMGTEEALEETGSVLPAWVICQ